MSESAQNSTLPAWAHCKDMSDADVTAAAIRLEFKQQGQTYTCGQGKQEGACSISAAFCKHTCGACKTPPAWTNLQSGDYCLSDRPNCNSSKSCGHTITDAKSCAAAAEAMPLKFTTGVTKISDSNAPFGCFVSSDRRLWLNSAGSQTSSYAFTKSLCAWNVRSVFSQVPKPRIETLNACGRNVTLPTYAIDPQHFEAATAELQQNSSRFALRLLPGIAPLSKELKLPGRNSTKLSLVLLGSTQSGTRLLLEDGCKEWAGIHRQPLTSRIDLNLHHIVIEGGVDVCFQDLVLENGSGDTGGAIYGVQKTGALHLRMWRCLMQQNTAKSADGGAIELKGADSTEKHLILNAEFAENQFMGNKATVQVRCINISLSIMPTHHFWP